MRLLLLLAIAFPSFAAPPPPPMPPLPVGKTPMVSKVLRSPRDASTVRYKSMVKTLGYSEPVPGLAPTYMTHQLNQDVYGDGQLFDVSYVYVQQRANTGVRVMGVYNTPSATAAWQTLADWVPGPEQTIVVQALSLPHLRQCQRSFKAVEYPVTGFVPAAPYTVAPPKFMIKTWKK